MWRFFSFRRILTFRLEDMGLQAVGDLRLDHLLGDVSARCDHILDDHATPEHNLQVLVGHQVQQALRPLLALCL